MVPLIFLIGGSGNVFYQLNYIEKKYKNKYIVSSLFYIKPIRFILKHTMSRPKINTTLREASFWQVLSRLILMLIDAVIFLFTRKTFFTSLDLYNFKVTPVFKERLVLGYFQDAKYGPLELHYNARIFLNHLKNKHSSSDELVVLHIRGGDYLSASETNMPTNTSDWMNSALTLLDTELHQINGIVPIVVVTDDLSTANKILSTLNAWGDRFTFKIKSRSISDDLQSLMNSKYCIAFNSTFALMALESSSSLKKAILSSYLSDKVMSTSLKQKVKFL